MSLQLAVVQVAGGWRVMGADFKSKLLNYKVDAVDLLLATGRSLAAEKADEVTLWVHEAGRLVRMDERGVLLETDQV
jgi:hypothetical protein